MFPGYDQLNSFEVMGEEEPIRIEFGALAAYHGQGALAMLAITFRGLGMALAALSPGAPVRRSDISIVSGHPGPGVRDAFEFATRVVTRNAYVVDQTLPEARLNPKSNISYSFKLTVAGKTITASLREGVLPERFFELNNLGSKRTDADNSEHSKLRRDIAVRVLAAPAESLFSLT